MLADTPVPALSHSPQEEILLPSRRRQPLHRRLPLALSLVLALTLLLPAPPAAANQPPAAPVVESPFADSVAPGDVHMELDRFRDPDGDAHAATDWEIRTADGATVVWAAYNSPELVHAHLADGAFQGPLAGETSLEFDTRYVLRVRVQDSHGAWSAWADHPFDTTPREQIAARQAQGILLQPGPRWQSDGGASISLPAGGRLLVETGAGTPVLTLAGTADGLLATAGARLPAPAPLRLHLRAPAGSALQLPSSRLSLVTDAAERLTIYLPTLALGADQSQVLWVTETGATFYGLPEQTEPAREHLARDVPLPWTLPAGYRLEAASGAFQLPTSLAFVADPGSDPAAPRFYVTELYGRIKVVTNDGRVFNFAEDLLNFNPSEHFVGSGELGVIGICLPPAGRDVYATTIFRAGDGLLRNRIIRLRSNDGLTATGLDEILVVGANQGNARSSHQVQQCSFGPDGKLYVFMADGPNPAAAQNDGTFNGKVLRLNPDGTAPTDNPRYTPANLTAPRAYQYSKGHRNAFGMTWRPSTGQLYLAENGPSTDRLVQIVPGRNYGWDGTDQSMVTEALYVWPEAHWSPVGLTFVEGAAAAAALPWDKQGHLFVAAAGPVYAEGPQPRGKAIQEFRLNSDGTIAGQPAVFAHYTGEGRGSIADLKLQPDGLYFTDLFRDDGDGGPAAPGGKVWRIRHTGQASFTPSLTTGPAPLTVNFTETSTFRRTVTWTWDFGDGATTTNAGPSHTFTRPGRYAVSLTLTAADGTTSEALTLITVTDSTGQVPETAPPVRLPAAPVPASVFFPEMGVSLGGGFKHYWEANGSLAQFGYPVTNELRQVNPADGQEYTVQYFERARFEYHPEHAGTPYETQLGLLGRQAAAGRLGEPAFLPVPDPGDGAWLAETGHTLRPPFRGFWEQTGGAAVYGLPISEAVAEGERPDGTPLLVQYFERARLEHRPEGPTPTTQVRLEPLGISLFVQQPPPRRP